MKKISRSKATAAKTMYAALNILKEAWWELPSREINEKVASRVDLTEWELARLEKTWYIRWESILHFFSIDFSKAWFLRKNKGMRYITDEWEQALNDHTEIELLEEAGELYKERDKKRKIEAKKEIPEDEWDELLDNHEQVHIAELEQLELSALDWLRSHIVSINPYEFQELVWALLRAMWYYTPFIAAKWKDWWIDLVAYADPLGAKPPRIKVQVKHRPNASISIDEIQRMSGLLNTTWDVWLIVTSCKIYQRCWNSSEKLKYSYRFDKFWKANGITTAILW